jgi:hypothetical protein
MRFQQLLSRFLTLCLLVTITSETLAIAVNNKSALPFNTKEQLLYEGKFSKLLLRNISIGEMEFKAERITAPTDCKCSTATIIRYTSDTRSKGWFTKLFGINFRHTMESIADPVTLRPFLTKTLEIQGSKQRATETIFDHENQQISWSYHDPQSPSKQTHVFSMKPTNVIFDATSGLYFLRTHQLVPGNKLNISLVSSGKIYNVPVRIIKKEKMKTIFGKVVTVRVDVEAFGEGGLVDKDGRFSIWFTDDGRHIPVRSIISTGVGELVLTLKKRSSN